MVVPQIGNVRPISAPNTFPIPGPAATGIPLPAFPHPGLTTKIAATAICDIDAYAQDADRRCVWPDGHWNWSAPMPYKHGNICNNVIHIGGQVSLDSMANVIHPGDMVSQTRVAMANLAKVLAEFEATLDDVVKVTTFYQGNAFSRGITRELGDTLELLHHTRTSNLRYPSSQSGLQGYGDRD